jgi:hypothetical protein
MDNGSHRRGRHAEQLPLKSRAKAISSRQTVEIDWLALWAISLGVCAVVMAATAFFAAADKNDTVFILVGAAALIALVLKANTRGYL